MKEIAFLIKQLTEPVTPDNEAACETAAIALGEKGDLALPLIEKLLTASDTDIRFWAVRSLWANGTPLAQDTLLNLLSDEADMICSAAALALGELQVPVAIPALTRLMMADQGDSSNHAADALSKIGPAAAQSLIQALANERSVVRIRAAKALVPLESHARYPPAHPLP